MTKLTKSSRCTKPGGYIEQLEMDIEFKSDDGSVGPDHIMKRWSKTFIDQGEEQGRTFKIAFRSKDYITAAVRYLFDINLCFILHKNRALLMSWKRNTSFQLEAGQATLNWSWSVNTTCYIVYMAWRVGLCGYYQQFLGFVFPMIAAFGTLKRLTILTMKWDYIEIQVFIAEMRAALLKKSNHAYYEV